MLISGNEYMVCSRKLTPVTKSLGVVLGRYDLEVGGARKGDLLEIFWRVVAKADEVRGGVFVDESEVVGSEVR